MLATKINQEFYNNIFPIWNNSPDYFWDGFWDLYPYIHQLIDGRGVMRVLDVGCANGRFFNFLELCFPEVVWEKVGIDFVPFVMVNQFKFVEVDVSTVDISQLGLGEFDLITMFGVYHHIQGQATRDNLTQTISKMLSGQSLFVFTRWNFLMLNRLRNHILGPEQLPDYSIQLDLNTWELGDYYLKWDKGISSVRYANMMDVYEISGMLKAANLTCLYNYNADDKLQNRNTYFICQHNRLTHI
jgi:SAM-dependent methyltransferase